MLFELDSQSRCAGGLGGSRPGYGWVHATPGLGGCGCGGIEGLGPGSCGCMGYTQPGTLEALPPDWYLLPRKNLGGFYKW